MKTLKSKQNIIVLILTSVICLVIIGYALINVYNTKLARSSSTSNTDTTSISKLSPSTSIDVDTSNFYKTLTLASSKNTKYIRNGINFDNPFNVSYLSSFNCVGDSANEYYVENAEVCVYAKFIYNGNLNDLKTKNFDMYIEGTSPYYSGLSPQGEASWQNYLCYDRSNTLYDIEGTVNPYDNSSFYVSAKYKTPEVTGDQYLNVEIQIDGYTIHSFQILVRDTSNINEDVSQANESKVCEFENSTFYNDYLIGYTPVGYYYSKEGNSYDESRFYYPSNKGNLNGYYDWRLNSFEYIPEDYNHSNSLSPNTTITIIGGYTQESPDDANLGTRRDYLSAVNYFKVIYLYPEYGYSIDNGTLLTAYCSDVTNSVYTLDDIQHTIPSWWHEETYTVIRIFFNYWGPRGQVHYIQKYNFNIDLISIDEIETKKQENNYYTENSEIYTYVVVNYSGSNPNDVLKDVKANFSCEKFTNNNLNSANVSAHFSTDIKSDYDVGYLDYTGYSGKYQNKLGFGGTVHSLGERNYLGHTTYDSTTGNLYLAIRWKIPEVDSGTKDYHMVIGVYKGSNKIGDCEFTITAHDTDYINQFASMDNYYTEDKINLSDATNNNVLEFQNATKKYYEKNVLGKVDTFEQSVIGQKLNDYDFKNQTALSNGSFSYKIFGNVQIDRNGKTDSIRTYEDYNNTNDFIKINGLSAQDKSTVQAGGIAHLYYCLGTNYPANRKVLVLYPEYGYDIAYGDLMVVEDYDSKICSDFKPKFKYNSIDKTIPSSLEHEYCHTIPLWWNESKDYTVIEILFNDWTPLGEMYYIQEITYNVEGSVYGDWYITRNVD